MGEISRADRKLLWGKSANRCAICRAPLSRTATADDPEIVVGEEAHIVGERLGAARYRPLPAAERDGYGNRILLCPTDHTTIDKQPGKWTEGLLLATKAHHESIMRLRTEEAKRSNGIEFENPGPVVLELVISGSELGRMMGRSLAHQMDCSELDGPDERIAATLFQSAADWCDIYNDIGPVGHADASENLSEHIREALEAGLILFGKVVDMNVRVAGKRDRWPVTILLMRRAEDVAREQKETAQAARDLTG